MQYVFKLTNVSSPLVFICFPKVISKESQYAELPSGIRVSVPPPTQTRGRLVMMPLLSIGSGDAITTLDTLHCTRGC